VVEAIFECDECVNSLTGEFVVDANDGSLGDRVCFTALVGACFLVHTCDVDTCCRKVALTMFDERGFDLSGGKSVAGYVDYVVNTSADPIVSLVIASGTIARKLLDISTLSLLHCPYQAKMSLRSIPCTHSSTYPYISCARPRRYEPYLAMACGKQARLQHRCRGFRRQILDQ
jgi:hypothetical protein